MLCGKEDETKDSVFVIGGGFNFGLDFLSNSSVCISGI